MPPAKPQKPTVKPVRLTEPDPELHPGEVENQPAVPINVHSPAGMAYFMEMQKRRTAAGAGKYNTPVAGGPTPNVPIFTDPRINELAGVAEKGQKMTLADAAAVVNKKTASPAPQQQDIFRTQPNEASGLLATDILTEEAIKDPTFIQGQGSMFAMHQPHLAKKYGVIRSGKWVPPQMLNQPVAYPDERESKEGMRLSSSTEEGLRAAMLYTQQQEQLRQQQEQQRQDSKVSKEVPTTTHAVPTKELTIEEKLSRLDAFDQNKVEEFVRDNDLNTREQKDKIEKRIKDLGYDLSIDEMVMTNKVRQRIPIKPGHFEIVLESLDIEVDLALKRLIMEEAKKQEVNEKYYLDKYSFMAITVSLVEIQGVSAKRAFPSCFDEQGRFNTDLFWKKWDLVVKLNFWMAASICTHFAWFDQRVQTLYRIEDIKNG